MLSRDDIKKALAEGRLKIYPLENKNLTGIGYNLTTTHFAFSINRGILLTIHRRITSHGIERYVSIPGSDTVLFFSKEYIEVDQSLAGTFHSKVSRVCQGLGHNSTTLDPSWKGQLIISVNNPTSNEIIFELDKDSGNIITLLLHKLDTEVTGPNIHDNNKGRCDLLLDHFTKPTNPEYREKHLMLEKFVVGDFADSLNGYDCFLGADRPHDRHTQRISQLLALRDRLEKERIILGESRYMLGSGGNYRYFKNESEHKLLQSCALYPFKNEFRNIPLPDDGVREADLAGTVPVIGEYIDIINYELEMIDHIRRIEWQNQKINEFAGEDSELVRLRRKNELDEIKRSFYPLSAGIPAVTLILFAAMCRLPAANVLWGALPTIYAPILTLALHRWYHLWKKLYRHKYKKHSTNGE